jgi:glycosyltransferase involved in cell wall biosynthesis
MLHQNNEKRKKFLNKNIAYILGTYPNLTTTFIDREILEVKKNGVNLVLIAVRHAPPFQMSSDIEKLSKEIKYILPVPWVKFVFSNLFWLITKPFTFLKTIFYIFSRYYDSNISCIKGLIHFAEGIRTLQLLKKQNISHIHAHFADRAAVIAMVASKFLNVSYSFTAHASDIYVSPILLSEKIMNAKFVTTCTAYNKAYLERLTGKHVDLVYHGIDIEKIDIRSELYNKSPSCLILSVGQLKEKKGFSYLIKACDNLNKEGLEFKCEIIGDGPSRLSLEKHISDLNLEDKVRLIGALPHNKVLEKYKQATIFALPCVVGENGDRDGIPNVLLEAMSNRIPVVSTRLSGIPELIKEGFTGLLVDPEDEVALAGCIARLLRDPELRNSLSQRGYQLIKDKFDIKKNVETLITLFD